jgi:histidinol-phosphate aminotransferase
VSWEDIIREELAGLTPYAPGLRASEVRERSGKRRVVKLSSNEHPSGPFPRAIAAIEAVAPHLNRYPDGSSRALRERLAGHLGIDAARVAVGSGSNELLRLIAQVVLRPDDEVVYAWPSFIVYPMVCGIFGAKAVPVPLKDDAHDLDAMLAAVTDRTRLLFLCNPNNPTGTIYRTDAFARFLDSVPEHVLVIADEAYFEFVDDPEYPDGMESFDGERPLVVSRTFSKMYSLAGLRVGYAAIPRPLATAIDAVREPFNVNSVAQIAAYHSMDDAAEVGRRRAENRDVRARLYDVFDRLGIDHVPSQANFVWLKSSNPAAAFDALLAEGVIVRAFGPVGALRVTMPGSDDLAFVTEAFEVAAGNLEGF